MEDAEITAPVMQSDYGSRVLSDGRRAPRLMVSFRCPHCGGEDVLDAFLGVPLCPNDNMVLIGQAVIHPTRPRPANNPDIAQVTTSTVGKPYEGSPTDHQMWVQSGGHQ